MERPSKALVSWSSTLRTSRHAPATLPPTLPRITEARTLPKKRRGCHEQCPTCSDPTPDPRCGWPLACSPSGKRAGLHRNRLGSLPVGQRKAASDPRGVAPARAWNSGSTVRLRQLVSNEKMRKVSTTKTWPILRRHPDRPSLVSQSATSANGSLRDFEISFIRSDMRHGSYTKILKFSCGCQSECGTGKV